MLLYLFFKKQTYKTNQIKQQNKTQTNSAPVELQYA